MKTSNIILLSFLVVVFLVPVGIFVILNKKVAANDFTIVEGTAVPESEIVNIALEPIKIVRIQSTGLEGTLTCNVIRSDSAFYTHGWRHETTQNIRVRQSGDTLIINYNFPDSSGSKPSYLNPSTIDLHLPSWETMEIDGATVHLKTEDSNSPSGVGVGGEGEAGDSTSSLGAGESRSVKEVVIMNKGKLTVDGNYKGRLNMVYP